MTRTLFLQDLTVNTDVIKGGSAELVEVFFGIVVCEVLIVCGGINKTAGHYSVFHVSECVPKPVSILRLSLFRSDGIPDGLSIIYHSAFESRSNVSVIRGIGFLFLIVIA